MPSRRTAMKAAERFELEAAEGAEPGPAHRRPRLGRNVSANCNARLALNDNLVRTLARYTMADWAAILAEHGPRVWRTAFRVLNHSADAHDCYQETFLAAWQLAR